MDGAAILAVGSAVIVLAQFAKWSGVPAKWAPLTVAILAVIGVAFWGWSVGNFERTQAFGYFAGWITVTAAAAGVFGFVREGSAGVMSGSKTDAASFRTGP